MSPLLDTNVLSEILRSAPDSAVLAWFSAQDERQLFVSAVTQAEMVLGARQLPPGGRRQRLEDALRGMFDADFADRVLPFDSASASHFADIVESRRRAGRPISQFDAQVAAIARLNGLSLATRNVRDFEGCGLQLVDPWS